MELFLYNVSSFPVVVYTFLLFIVVFYWVLAMIGAVDIELFDADVEIGLELDTDVDVDAEGLSGVTGFMLKWGLTGIPVTVVVSLLILFSWMICYFVVSIFYPLIPWQGIKPVLGIAVIVVSFMLAIPVTAWMIKPFKGIFVTHSAVRKASLIGKECTIKTGSVSSEFGQADLEDGGAGMLLDVRAESTLGLKKGDAVILIAYDEEDGSYTVARAD